MRKTPGDSLLFLNVVENLFPSRLLLSKKKGLVEFGFDFEFFKKIFVEQNGFQ
jgi:hypothetical protein